MATGNKSSPNSLIMGRELLHSPERSRNRRHRNRDHYQSNSDCEDEVTTGAKPCKKRAINVLKVARFWSGHDQKNCQGGGNPRLLQGLSASHLGVTEGAIQWVLTRRFPGMGLIVHV